jgi:hypothetical protein
LTLTRAVGKSSKAAEQLRRMMMKQKAIGRANLELDERFYLEFRLPAFTPPAAEAATEAPQPRPPTSFFLYFPQNWTAGRAFDAARDLIPGWAAAPGLVPLVARSGAEIGSLTFTATRSTPLRDLAPSLEPFDAVDLVPAGLEHAGLGPAERAALLANHEASRESIPKNKEAVGMETVAAAGAATFSPADALAPNSATVNLAAATAASPDRDVGVESVLMEVGCAAERWAVTVQCGKAGYDVANLDPATATLGDLKARLARLAFPALDSAVPGAGAVGTGSLTAAAAGLKLFIKGKKVDDLPETRLSQTKVKDGSKLTMILPKK